MHFESQEFINVTPAEGGGKKKSFRETYYENQYKKLNDKVFNSSIIQDQEFTP